MLKVLLTRLTLCVLHAFVREWLASSHLHPRQRHQIPVARRSLLTRTTANRSFDESATTRSFELMEKDGEWVGNQIGDVDVTLAMEHVGTGPSW